MLAPLLAALLSATPAPPLKVAVLSLQGDAPPPARARASRLVLDALRSIESVEVISLLEVEPVLGAAVAKKVEACTDDACLREALAAISVDRIIAGQVNAAEQTLARLELRSIPTSSAASSSRLSRDLSGDLMPAIEREAPAAVAELFADRAAKGFGTLVLRVSPRSAAVLLDDYPVGVPPVPPLKIPVGKHRLRVEAKGHETFEEDVEVPLGRTVERTIQLEKRRSEWPLILGASAAGAAAIGLALGLSADSQAENWVAACGSGQCSPGFTRLRYEDERSSVDTKRTTANVLFVGAAALAVGALVYYIFDPGVEGSE